MSEQIAMDLETFGRKIAQEVAGDAIVEAVEAEEVSDWTGKPAYYFAFLIEATREERPEINTRISARLWDELRARGDSGMPIVRVLGHRDWEKRGRAWGS